MSCKRKGRSGRSVDQPLGGRYLREGAQVRIKKMLLAGMVLAGVAFAAPATASAKDVWTADGETLGPGEEATASFEGFIGFTTSPPVIPVHSVFGCPVTVSINAVGPSGGTIETFKPTTGFCEGTGIFKGCVLTHATSSPPWEVSISSTPGMAPGPVTVHNEYHGCISGITTTHLVYEPMTLTPMVSGGHLAFAVSGIASNGNTTTFGTLSSETASNQPRLGIETIN